MVLSIEPFPQTPPPPFWGALLTLPPSLESPVAPVYHVPVIRCSSADSGRTPAPLCSPSWR